MIVWSGWGILVVPLVVVTVGIFGFATGAAGLNEVGGIIAGFLVAAPLTWLLGQKLNGPDASRTLVDPETGEAVVLRRRHSLFFIPVQYWSIPCVILAVVLLALLLMPSAA